MQGGAYLVIQAVCHGVRCAVCAVCGVGCGSLARGVGMAPAGKVAMFELGSGKRPRWRVADVGLVVCGPLGLQADDVSIWWHPVVLDHTRHRPVRGVWLAAPVLLADVVPASVVRKHRRVAGWA